MKEFVEKLIERLEEKSFIMQCADNRFHNFINIDKIKNTINQLAEEYNNTSTDISIKQLDLSKQIADDLNKVLKEAKNMGCKEVRAFHHIPLENVETVIKALRAYNQDSIKNNQGWIPVTERLPEENKDGWTPIMLSIKTGEVIFGLWHDETIGFCKQYKDGVCKAGGVIAWQPLPEPYKPEEKQKQPKTISIQKGLTG